eukprot:257635-Pleurochrysis_carterae.AAC.3
MAGPTRSGSGAGSWAARRPAPRLWGDCIGSTHPTGSGTQSEHVPARLTAGSERSEAPRWSLGRPPRAPRPRRASPILKEKGARQPAQTRAVISGGTV